MLSYKSLFALLVVIGMATALPILGGGSGSGLPVPTIPGVPIFQLVHKVADRIPSLIPVTLEPGDFFTFIPDPEDVQS